MKPKKKKKIHIQQSVLKQHGQNKNSDSRETYASFNNLADVKTFIFKNIDFFILITILIAVVFANGINGAFISDDISTYVSNPEVRDLSGSFNSLLLQSSLYATYFALFKLNPIPMHIVSVLMHILNVFLFFLFVSSFFSKKISMFATTLFAVHPITTEAVTWISGNNYIMLSIYTFLVTLLYVIYKNSNNKKYFWACLAVFSLGIVVIREIQTLLVFGIIVILDQFLIEKKFNFKSAKNFWPFLIPSIAFLVYLKSAIVTRVTVVGKTSIIGANPTNFKNIPPYSIYMTLRLMFFPDKLTLYHDSEIITTTMLRVMVVVTVLFALTLLLLIKKNKKLAGLMLIAFTSFSYMLSPIQIAWFFAERYVYFATAIFAIFIALLFIKLEKIFKTKNLALILLVILTCLYSVRTIIRNNDWKTRKSLWEATLKVVPYSARTYNNLGDVYSEEGNLKASAEAFSRAVQLKPDYDAATHNLGLTYLKMGELEKADAAFRRALQLNPNLYQAYFHLGVIEVSRQNYPAAEQYVRKSLEIEPRFEPALLLLNKLEEAKSAQINLAP